MVIWYAFKSFPAQTMSWSSSARPASVLFPSSSVIDQIRLQRLVNWWRTRYENWLMAASMSLVFSDHLRKYNTVHGLAISLHLNVSIELSWGFCNTQRGWHWDMDLRLFIIYLFIYVWKQVEVQGCMGATTYRSHLETTHTHANTHTHTY